MPCLGSMPGKDRDLLCCLYKREMLSFPGDCSSAQGESGMESLPLLHKTVSGSTL